MNSSLIKIQSKRWPSPNRCIFDCILIEEEFGAGKPDERIFRHALEKLNVAPSNAWMVGDNLERDIGGAQAVGISGIWVDWRGGGVPNPPPLKPNKKIRKKTD